MDSESKPVRHILIIEDEESIRNLLETQLYRFGYSVSSAATGLHALQKLKAGQKYDLILCDLKMPGMSGLDLFRQYKNNQGIAPFVMLTGFPEKAKIVEAIQMGVRDVILKPIRPTELIERLESFIKETQSASEAS